MTNEISAKLKYLKITPRKTRSLADIIRGLSAEEAKVQLMFSKRRAGISLLKLLESAIANAKNNHQLDVSKLFVKEIRVDQGPKSKRWTPRARGSVNLIEKKSSHVTLILGVSDKLPNSKYIFEEKKKKEKVVAKADKGKMKEKADEIKEVKPRGKEKKPDKSNFFRKVFRRKSI